MSKYERVRKAKRREALGVRSTRPTQSLCGEPGGRNDAQRSAGGPGPAERVPLAARRSPQPRALVRLEKRAVPRNPAPAASHR